MRLGDIQNLVGKTLDVQALTQVAVSHPDLAVRQTEKNLAMQRQHQQAMVQEGAESSASGIADDAEGRRAAPQPRKRYRLAWKSGQGASLEPDQAPLLLNHRLDLRA
jgi:hypothetical protein